MNHSADKIVLSAETLRDRVAALPRPVVFTNGCFDILHRGHVDYLEQAAALGASLVVGVNSDDSVKSLGKDPNRPVNPLEDRMAILAALQCVSLVVPFEESTPIKLIQTISPDHLVKGGDWKTDNIVGADFVRANGGKVHSIPFRFDRSTTALIRKIQQSNE